MKSIHSPDHLEYSQSHTLVFKYHFDSLYNYGIKVINDSELVKDCIQELFYRMWKNNIDFSKVMYPKSYLLKGLRRQILNVLELKYHQTSRVEVEDHISIDFSPEDYFIQNQYEENLRIKIINALNQLSKKQREAIYLRYFENLEYFEIAEIMNINLQSVKNNVQRGLNSLKHLLGMFLFYYFFKEILLLIKIN
jgi:RNA polymerase sigma factor (sigma-70 family)